MEVRNAEKGARRIGSRGLSGSLAAVVMVVVILVVGGAGYVALKGQGGASGGGTTSSSLSNCQPTSSPICKAANAAHDVTLLVPFKSVQQGNPVPFTATLPSGESPSSYNFSYGDGANSGTTTASTVSHTYRYPGTYIASVSTLVKGAVHDNYHSLVLISVSGSFSSASAGNTPSVSGMITANSSTTSNPTGVIQTNQFVSVTGTYTGAPTNPVYTSQTPKIAAPAGVTTTSSSATGSSASGQFTFPTAGTYSLTFVGSAVGPLGAMAYQNFTWTVFVAASGSTGAIAGSTSVSSPHHGSLDVYELAPGGSNSEDPAIDYESLGYEVLLNVYQGLIAYNGSQTGPTPASYVPVIATCVPGSTVGPSSCQGMYGSTLVSGSDYTFAISKAAKFYDPSTHNSWSVYPTDVVFSVARTMAFSTNPGVGSNNGWILTQSLLPNGNRGWSTLHFPFNNTPQNIMNAVTINDSTYCQPAEMANSNGCVTFHVAGAGQAWPYFLELISDEEGAAIVPCGWFSASAQGAGIPDWTVGNSAGNGDHPCGAMGSSGWGVAPSALSPTAWDSWELAASAPPFVGNVQYHMAGSGPYALQSLIPATSYTLEVNPAYASNPYCTWTGCMPQPGTYVKSVSVTWEASQVPGEQAYEAGTADLASIPSTDTAFTLQLLAQGKILATSFPSISIFFFPYNFYFSKAGAATYTTSPITVPADFFGDVGVRQFFTHAYPYNTVEQTINTKDGLQYLFDYGGAIPQFMANYYPTNVSFPMGDPSSSASTPGTAAWWWAQITTPSSQYYDANLTSQCTTSSPCQLPFFGQTGAPNLDEATALWASEVNSISGGRIHMNVVDINFVTLVINSAYLGPYNNPMPFFTLGWAPDYPDPTDYVTPLYLPDNTYTLGDAIAEQLSNPQYDSSSCANQGTTMADFFYWANQASATNGAGGVPTNCQGPAYHAMLLGLANASTLAAGPQRVLMYNLAEQIANGLALYTYWGQQNLIVTTASWIDPTSYNSNVTIGGGTDSTWFTITGNGIL